MDWIDATDGGLGAACDTVVLALDADLEHVTTHTRLLLRADDWNREGELVLISNGVWVTSERVVSCSFDQSNGTPALDQIAGFSAG